MFISAFGFISLLKPFISLLKPFKAFVIRKSLYIAENGFLRPSASHGLGTAAKNDCNTGNGLLYYL